MQLVWLRMLGEDLGTTRGHALIASDAAVEVAKDIALQRVPEILQDLVTGGVGFKADNFHIPKRADTPVAVCRKVALALKHAHLGTYIPYSNDSWEKLERSWTRSAGAV